VLANSRVAAAQRCLHRLKHLIDLPCHAHKTEVTEPLGSEFRSFLFICLHYLSYGFWSLCPGYRVAGLLEIDADCGYLYLPVSVKKVTPSICVAHFCVCRSRRSSHFKCALVTDWSCRPPPTACTHRLGH